MKLTLVGLGLALLLGATEASAAPASAPAACDAARQYSEARSGVSVLVLSDGKVVCESYGPEGGPDRGHEIWSGTKSFNGLILAAAVQDGLLTLDEPVSRTLPEWRSDPAKAAVTLRQLLSLTSGLRSTVGRAPDYAEAIAAPLAAAPGTRFQYGATPFQVFGEVMQRKLAAAGREPDVLAYLKSRILDPIDAHWSDWRRTPAGDALLPQGAVFTAREWAKFGEFVRAGGSVGGKPLVDQAAFAQLFKGSAVNPAYGLSWWLPAATNQPDVVTARLDLGVHAGDLPADLVIAAGAGNQRLYVSASCGVTIVRQATFDPATAMRSRGQADAWSDYAFLKPLLDAFCG
jgi:CubicO group peptidase (beta-lactamase class C family)